MPEALLLAVALAVAGAVVLRPVLRPSSAETDVADDPRDAAALRHRVALEALRDVAADRRAGSLDDEAYAAAMADAEARATRTRAELEAVHSSTAPSGVESIVPGDVASWRERRVAVVAAAAIAIVLVGGALLPATGIANETRLNESLAEVQAAEAARQHEIEELTEQLAANPEDPELVSRLADAYLAGSSERDLAAAAAALQLLIALEPQRADAYERIVAAYLRAGSYVNARRALDSYTDAPSADPVEVAFLDGLIALRGEGNEERAAAAFDRFLELAPDDPRADMVRGLRDDVTR